MFVIFNYYYNIKAIYLQCFIKIYVLIPIGTIDSINQKKIFSISGIYQLIVLKINTQTKNIMKNMKIILWYMFSSTLNRDHKMDILRNGNNHHKINWLMKSPIDHSII